MDEVATIDQHGGPPVLMASSPMASMGLMAPQHFDHAWRVAQVYANTMVVPENYRKKPEDCLILMNLATRLEVDIFMLFQSMSIVRGKPCMEGKLVIALVNSRGPFCKPLSYAFSGSGKTRKVVCTGEYLDGSVAEMEMSWALAEANGWVKANPKWNSMTDQMLRYRSASWLGRAYCPDVLLGMYTPEEILDEGVIEDR